MKIIIKQVAASIIAVLLTACDSDGINAYFQQHYDTPKIALGAGIELNISENEVVKVYGYDMCETGFEDDDPLDDFQGCVLITGNEYVDVYFRSGDLGVKEQWRVVVVDDSQYSLKRPNGWLVRRPSVR